MAAYMIETRELEYKYPDGTRALKGINMGVQQGKKIAVLGANGAGKSTLFLHFNGILRPSKGKVLFEGKEISYAHRSLMQLRSKVGIVFQDPDAQIFSSNVMQEVSFGPLNLGLTRKEAMDRVEAALEATGIYDLKERPVHFLSHGQKKRVAIAGVLAMQPRVMVLDEPAAGLDPGLTVKMIELFEDLSRQGVTLILSTHDVDLAYGWSDYVFVMQEGNLFGAGSPEQVFQDQGLVREAGLTTPWVLDMYNALKDKGWLDEELTAPRQGSDLLQRIKDHPFRHPGTGTN